MEEKDPEKAMALLHVFYYAGDHRALRRVSDDPSVDPRIRAAASGLLMRRWLPWGARRQFVMLTMIAAVITFALLFKSWALLVLLVVPLSFSPRIVGETLVFFGRVARG